jgi:acyl carrier protein
MTEDDVRQAIVNGLAEIAPECDPGALRGTDPIRRTLDIDSYDFLSLLIGLHERLGVDIPEADYGRLGTLDEMVAYVVERVAKVER